MLSTPVSAPIAKRLASAPVTASARLVDHIDREAAAEEQHLEALAPVRGRLPAAPN